MSAGSIRVQEESTEQYMRITVTTKAGKTFDVIIDVEEIPPGSECLRIWAGGVFGGSSEHTTFSFDEEKETVSAAS